MAKKRPGRHAGNGRFIVASRRPVGRAKVRTDVNNDFNAFEEAGNSDFFTHIGLAAATNAVNENKAMNLPVTYLQDGWVVREMPGGRMERITQIQVMTDTVREKKLTKGTVLHVNKSR